MIKILSKSLILAVVGTLFAAGSVQAQPVRQGQSLAPRLAPVALPAPPRIIAADGTYLGTLSMSPYDPESVSNPYGRYGSKYSPVSIKNPYGVYGSQYSPLSPTNPYAPIAPVIPEVVLRPLLPPLR